MKNSLPYDLGMLAKFATFNDGGCDAMGRELGVLVDEGCCSIEGIECELATTAGFDSILVEQGTILV